MSSIEEMRAKVKEADKTNTILFMLRQFKNGEIISEGHREWQYDYKSPFIRIGSVHTYSSANSKDEIADFHTVTNGLTEGMVGGYSSAWDSSDWAVITVPLKDLSDKTIGQAVKKIKKFCPDLVVTFNRSTKEEYK